MTILDKLASRIQEDADCMLWLGGCCNGHPSIRHDGKSVLLRRILWEERNGPIPAGHIVRVTCESVKCVNPDHIHLTTRKKLGKELGAIGIMSGPVRSAAIARTKRVGHQAKLTLEAVRDIRNSTERGRVLALRWGVSAGHISKIQKHQAFRDFTSPFAGLGARAAA